MEANNAAEVSTLQSQLATVLESLNKLKEEQKELNASLGKSKEYAKQLQANIDNCSISKAQAELELAQDLSDPRQFIEATRMLNPRQLYWVNSQLGAIMAFKGAAGPVAQGYNPYYQYSMMPM